MAQRIYLFNCPKGSVACTTLPPTNVNTDSIFRILCSGNRQIVIAENGKVGELSFGERTDMLVVEGEPGSAFGVKAQCFQT